MNSNSRKIYISAVMVLCMVALAGVYLILCLKMNHGHIGNSYSDFMLNYTIKIQPVGAESSNAFSFPNMPWTILFDKVLFFSFLPLRQAQICFTILTWALYFMSIIITWSVLKEFLSSRILVLISLLPAAQFSLMYSVWFGNKAAFLCLLLIDAILIVRKHPYIAGIFLAVSMGKPQITGIVCLMLLIRGHYKALIVGAVIDIAAWFAVSVMMNSTMMNILQLCMNAGVHRKTQYLGIIAMLQYYGLSRDITIMLSVASGIIYMLVLYFYLRKNISSERLFDFMAYIPACFASVFWMYKNGTDFLILAYPAAFALIMCLCEQVSRKDFIILTVLIVIMLLSRCLVYFGIVMIDSSDIARDAYKCFESVLLFAAGIILCRECVKNQSVFDSRLLTL